MKHEISVGRHRHVPDDADAGRNRPALELFGFRVESNQRIGPLVRFVVPDDVVHDRNRIRLRPRTLGDGHVFTSPVLGFRRPSNPSAKSTYHTMSSLESASRRIRVAGVGTGYSVTSIVSGLMLASLLLPL